ncbi:hypothetical protein LY76DRAFT_641456 [Colletotrichum caudatum]|nr:hypothetical protein LY76DRAFT_641456 [Colletotrichum caudatum]
MEKLSLEHCRPLLDDEDAYNGTVDPRTLDKLPLDNPIEMTTDLTNYYERLRQKRSFAPAYTWDDLPVAIDSWLTPYPEVDTWTNQPAADEKPSNPEVIFPHTRPSVLESNSTACVTGINEQVAGHPRSVLATIGIGHFDPSVATCISIMQPNILPMSICTHCVPRNWTITTQASLTTVSVIAFVKTPSIEYHTFNARRARLAQAGFISSWTF